MAAPTYVAAGTVSHGSGTGGTRTPGLPTGWAQDDILVLVVTYVQGDTVTTPTGYTQATNSPSTSSDGLTGLRVYWKRAGASESAPSIGTAYIARIFAIRGCITTGNPWDITGASSQAASSTSTSITGVTTTVADTFVFHATTGNNVSSYSAWSNSTLGTVTERADNSDTSVFTQGAASGVKTTAGATGTTTATSFANGKAHHVIAFKAGNTAVNANAGAVSDTVTTNQPTGSVGAKAQVIG